MKISDVEPDITASVISANEIAASSLESPAGIDNVEIETETTNKDIAIEAIKDPVSSSVSKQEKRSPWVLF